MNGSTANVFMK